MIEIIPAIDIIDGKCVRLTQGDYSSRTEYATTPLEMARLYARAGVKRLHLVDLDGAKAGHPCNLASLKDISENVDIETEWGGGIKTDADLESVFGSGASHAIIGSVAVKNPELMEGWLSRYGGDHIILGADIRDGKVSVSGWLEDSTLTIDDLLERFEPYGLRECVVTDISRDGMLQGPNYDLYTSLMMRWPGIIFTVSGGISSMEEIRHLEEMGLPRVITGKAIYENRISLEELHQHICLQKE